jgi:molybdate transport system regulatory protein
MNRLTGNIVQIQKSGAIILADVEMDGQRFSALLIESASQPDWLKEGNVVDLVFKETEVSLAKDRTGLISMRNRLLCTVLEVQKGTLFSNVVLKYKDHTLMSAITTRSVESLQISPGDDIEALIKSNEISLMKHS